MLVKKKIIAIDPGIVRIGLAIGEFVFRVDQDYDENKNRKTIHSDQYQYEISEADIVEHHITWHFCATLNLIDLVSSCDQKSCSLHHTNEMVDRVDHLLKLLPMFFEVDLILIERQQPGACTDVQNLLMSRFDRNIVVLLAANSRNKYIGATNVSGTPEERRLQRKIITVRRVLKWMNPQSLQGFANFNEWKTQQQSNTNDYSRNLSTLIDLYHDSADALLLIVMYCKLELWKQIRSQIQQHNQLVAQETLKGMSCNDFLEQFRYQNTKRFK